MYKETLDVLMEDINDHNNIKQTILKNQLQSHFTNKTPENKNVQDNAAVIVRRILSNFTLGEIIGIQPVIDKEAPIVTIGDVEYDIDIATRNLQTSYPDMSKGDLRIYNGIDLECEINEACALEIETEITNEFIQIISQNATPLSASVDFPNSNEITDMVISAAKEINGNWIVTSPVLVSMLQSGNKFKSDSVGVGHIMAGLMYVGTLNNNIKVYTSLYGVGNAILIGNKHPDREDTAIVYAPETMIVVGNRTKKSEFDVSTMLHTRYEKFIMAAMAKKEYTKLSITFSK